MSIEDQNGNLAPRALQALVIVLQHSPTLMWAMRVTCGLRDAADVAGRPFVDTCVKCGSKRCLCWYTRAVAEISRAYHAPAALVHMIGAPHRIWHPRRNVARTVSDLLWTTNPETHRHITVWWTCALLTVLTSVPFRRDLRDLLRYHALFRPLTSRAMCDPRSQLRAIGYASVGKH